MSSEIRKKVASKFPMFKEIVCDCSSISNSVWDSDISSGKALEIISLITLISEIADRNNSVLMDQKLLIEPWLFYLRNELPLHHGAQAGHEATIYSEHSLKDRFIASITPKATFKSSDGHHWMVFREGNPLHLLYNIINGQPAYKSRCDICIVR